MALCTFSGWARHPDPQARDRRHLRRAARCGWSSRGICTREWGPVGCPWLSFWPSPGRSSASPQPMICRRDALPLPPGATAQNRRGHHLSAGRDQLGGTCQSGCDRPESPPGQTSGCALAAPFPMANEARCSCARRRPITARPIKQAKTQRREPGGLGLLRSYDVRDGVIGGSRGDMHVTPFAISAAIVGFSGEVDASADSGAKCRWS